MPRTPQAPPRRRKVVIWKTFIKAMEVSVSDTDELDVVADSITDEQWDELEGDWQATTITDSETGEVLYESDA